MSKAKWTIYDNDNAVGVFKVNMKGIGRAYATRKDGHKPVQYGGLHDLADSLGVKHVIAQGNPDFVSHVVKAIGYPVKASVTYSENEILQYASAI